MNKSWMATMALFVTFGASLTTHAGPATGPFSFGVGPVQSATELAKRWNPVMQYLSEKTGVQLYFQTAKDIPTFQSQMKDSQFDFVFINPYHYITFSKTSGYTAFAHEKDGKLRSILVVKNDGPIHDVAQLAGQTIAFPAPNAFAATWLQLNMLRDKNIDVTPQYVNSLDSVYRSVAKGLFPAGGGEMRTFGSFDPATKAALRVLWTSEALPPFAFAVHSRVPKEVVALVQKALDNMDQSPEGLALLKANNFNGMEAADDKDYDAIRKMNIRPIEAK